MPSPSFSDRFSTGVNLSITNAGFVYSGVKLTQAAQTERRNTRLEVASSHFTKLMKREITPLFYAGVRTSNSKLDGKQVLREIDDWAQQEYNNPNCKDKSYVERFLNAHERYELQVKNTDNPLNYQPVRQVTFAAKPKEMPFATAMGSIRRYHNSGNQSMTCVITKDEFDAVMNDARLYADSCQHLVDTSQNQDQVCSISELSGYQSTVLNKIEAGFALVLVLIISFQTLTRLVKRYTWNHKNQDIIS